MPLDKFDDNDFAKMVTDRVNEILDAVEKAAKTELLVGIPEANADRENPKGSNINNAALAYIHNYGSERAGIPPRPFMEPGLERVQEELANLMEKGLKGALDGSLRRWETYMRKAGDEAVLSIKNMILEGIPPPLKAKSVAGRRAARKPRTGLLEGIIRPAEEFYKSLYSQGWTEQELFESRWEPRGNTYEQTQTGRMLAVPLVNTGQMLNAITYVLRET